MDMLRSAWLDDVIQEDVYKENALKTTKFLLNGYGFKYLDKIGKGTFGDVLKFENRKKQKIAAKVVLKDHVSKSETDIWSNLKNEFILPLDGQIEFPDAHTHTFFMPLCETSLDQQLESVDFHNSKKGFQLMKNWLKDITNGLNYLHQQDICHLDLKVNNVLIKQNGTACICDFGFACSTEKMVENYASPYPYRSPEALWEIAVDGKKYDIWTLGVLAIEMFTSESLFQNVPSNIEVLYWSEHVYPVMFEILKEKVLKSLMKDVSPKSKLTKKSVKSVRNFILSCLNIKAEDRPSCSELLSLKIFGGSTKIIKNHDDIWNELEAPLKIRKKELKYIEEIEMKNECMNESQNAIKGDMEMESEIFQESQNKAATGEVQIIEPEKCIENESSSCIVEQDIDDVVVDTPKPSKSQKVRQWFKETKNRLSRIFLACIPVRKAHQ